TPGASTRQGWISATPGASIRQGWISATPGDTVSQLWISATPGPPVHQPWVSATPGSPVTGGGGSGGTDFDLAVFRAINLLEGIRSGSGSTLRGISFRKSDEQERTIYYDLQY
ncbi:MAG: hypothetical protein OXL96_28185, partial [Candidatus Poribacteria bacterium]|nr:hypothetical protein [Candidatus Poribacteria bacterium]